ncbi:MarR family winged helix-turn-helix transcriptional regulator [Aureibacillus halotolerans]|uniref:DNA-binding MarR family transcriptional regulator n=1 Tax=Aureibacillus halotolerans TaxID=1508390 RepID=A0A4R6UCK5_9BACI|nr:MarR family transcriptional regulator [Aureibacillus halotolerans]TDQ42759.1 DNA-binding MarR family transcriptional regulator [Aureibacillus halotolerans]
MIEEKEQIQRFMASLREIRKLMDQVIRVIATEMDSTPLQLFVLSYLGKNPDQSLKHLADELKVSNSTMSGVVDRLVQSNLVKRDRSSEDRRVLVMNLTEEGKDKQNQFKDFFYKRLEEVEQLPEEDMETLLSLHQKVIAQIKKGSLTHE